MTKCAHCPAEAMWFPFCGDEACCGRPTCSDCIDHPGLKRLSDRLEKVPTTEAGRVAEAVCPECKSHEGEPHEPWCANQAGKVL